MVTAATRTAVSKWAGGMARFPQTDATAPTTPTAVTPSSDGSTTVKLTWGAATDNSGSVSYQILRNDRVVATTTGTSITVPKGGENRFFVRAVDAAGNLSASSPAVVTSGGNPSPVAAFTSTVAGWTETFDASGSTDNGSIADYAWNFGDGSTGSGVTVSHTYTAAGTYQVRLVVTDDGGERAGLMKTLTVVQPAPNDAYGAAVYGENTLYYRLGEGSGGTAADSSTSDSPGIYSGGVTLGQPGELPGAPDTSAAFDGISGRWQPEELRQPQHVLAGAVVQHDHHPGRQADRLRGQGDRNLQQL